LRNSETSDKQNQIIILDLKSSLLSKDEEIQKIHSELTTFQSNHGALKSNYEVKIEELANLQKVHDFSSQKLLKKKAKIQRICEESEQKSQKILELEKNHEDLLSELSKLQIKSPEPSEIANHKKLELENSELLQKNSEQTILLQEKEQHILQKISEIETLNSKLEFQELDLQEVRTKIQVFSEQISQYQTSLEDKTVELLSQNAKNKSLAESLQIKTTELNEYKQESEIHLKNLEKSIAELSSEISTLHYQLELRECEKNSLESQLNNMTKYYEKLLVSSKEKLQIEDFEIHDKELKKIKFGMEKRGSFGEISNIMINETSEIIRDIDSKQGAPDEEAQKLKQELKLKEEVLLKKTEEFHFLQNSLEKENHSLKEEINKFKGFEELKEKYQNLDRKYNALEKDFITAKAILLININIFFILYLYSSIGHKMMGIQKN